MFISLSVFMSLFIMFSMTVFAQVDLENWGMSTVSQLEYVFTNEGIHIDMETVDHSAPFSISETVIAYNGEEIEITISLVPDISISDDEALGRGMWTGTATQATQATWNIHARGISWSLSYDINLSRAGSGWEISNARNLHFVVFVYSVTDSGLSIGQARSTAMFPATVEGFLVAELTQLGVTLATIRASVTATVSHGGVLTVRW